MKQTKLIVLSLLGTASIALTNCSGNKSSGGYTDRDIGFAGTVTQMLKFKHMLL